MPIRSKLRGSVLLRYGLASLLAAVALFSQLALDEVLGPGQDPGTYQFFLSAVALSAIWAGRYCALWTLLLSVLIRLYFFFPPDQFLAIEHPAVLVRVVLFAGVGILIAVVGGALYESEERFSTALTSIGDAVITTDDRRAVSFMNPVAESLSGWSAGVASGRSIEDVLHLVDERTNGRVDPPVAGAIDSGATIRLREETALISRSGAIFAIEDSAAPIRGGSRQPRGAVMVFRDVSQQRLAQKALRESEQRYRFLSDAVPEFIFTANAKGECDYFNQRWCDYTGLSVEESKGFNWISALHPEDVSATLSRWTNAVRSGEPFEVACRLLNQAGDARAFLIRGIPMADSTGEIQRLFGVCTDVEDLKRTERQLHESQKMEAIGRLAGGVAHDFNNLLTIFSGYGWMLRASAAQGSPEWNQADQICQAAQQASTLTAQLLAFSRRQVIQPVVLDLNAVVRETEEILRRVIGEDIAIETSLDPGLAHIRADRGQIVQILMNLSVNSRDAMPQGGRLRIETQNVNMDQTYLGSRLSATPGRYVLLAVSDSGQGMDAETQSRAFEPFFTTKGPGKGTGLGLSTVYGIVSQNGGYVWLYSEPGKGTVARIYLPAVGDEEVLETPTDTPSWELRGTETVLVVEDQMAVLKLIESILSPQGYTVLYANTPETAIKLCREEHPIDLLLTDVVMPGMSGRHVAEEVRSSRPGLPVLYMSGYTDEMIGQNAEGDFDGAFIQKPFTADQLLRKVREVLDARAKGHA